MLDECGVGLASPLHGKTSRSSELWHFSVVIASYAFYNFNFTGEATKKVQKLSGPSHPVKSITKMPAYSPYSVELMFIRSAGSKSSTDDTIRVRKNFETGEFEMIYTDSHNVKKQVHKLHSLYRQRVLDHFYLTFKNLSLDEDNFHQLQLNMPAMPPILVGVENLKDLYYRDHLLELIDNGLSNLDVLEKVNVAPPAAQQQQPQAQQQPIRILSPSMDNFITTHMQCNLSNNVCERRRSARLAQAQGCCGAGADVSGTARRLNFDEDEDEDEDDEYY